MDLKTLLTGLDTKNINPPKIKPNNPTWDKPSSEKTTPQITQQKFRRYFEFGNNMTTDSAGVEPESYNTFLFDYPVIVRQLQLQISGDAGMDTSGDRLKLIVDDSNVLLNGLVDDLLLGGGHIQLQTEHRGTATTAAHTITDNLGATATESASTTTYATAHDHGYTRVQYAPLFSWDQMQSGADLDSWYGWWLGITLDTYAAKKFQIYYKNVQAHPHDVTLTWQLITDRPIEYQYSGQNSGVQWSGGEMHYI